MEDPTSTFATEIKSLRKKHHISQKELADLSGVSLPSINRMERGKETIRLDILVKVLNCLGYELHVRPKTFDQVRE